MPRQPAEFPNAPAAKSGAGSISVALYVGIRRLAAGWALALVAGLFSLVLVVVSREGTGPCTTVERRRRLTRVWRWPGRRREGTERPCVSDPGATRLPVWPCCPVTITACAGCRSRGRLVNRRINIGVRDAPVKPGCRFCARAKAKVFDG